jgi:hypothetical protein
VLPAAEQPGGNVGGRGLAFTGAQIAGLVLAAAVLASVGAMALIVARRRAGARA